MCCPESIPPTISTLRLWMMTGKSMYSIYVLELAPFLISASKMVPTAQGYLYVGMTAKAVTDRKAQHQYGGRLAGRVFRALVRDLHRPLTDADLWLRVDLVTVRANGDSQRQTESAERALANKLKHAGYVVLSRHEHSTKRAKAKSPRSISG